ncbi:polysaccharide deacetylase family protein [Virgibacillus profundi]|uniref:polysaccharide deacetylase family protein n=1 Tax=Virgibacillus profundi TaxID=2024555 RepID=UPI0013FD3D06|nr:polysaccharide deacetylase family protein [Virgibacillus profundi]
MNYKKGVCTLFSTFLLCIFLSACQHSDEGDRNSRPQPEQTKYNQEAENENLDDQLRLAGGSEKNVRQPRPVSNNKLQKEYSNIVVLRGALTENEVALTFDDGPDIRFTPQVLDVLAKHDVKATFFLLGSRAKAHREIVKRIQDEGHAIGNHTYWHPNLSEEDLGRLHWELMETEQVIADITGFKPRLFRSPYGALNEEIVKMLGEEGNTVIGWNVDSLDWKQPGAEIISDNVLSNVGFGSIILMHDGGDWTLDLSGTAQALDEIISKLKEDGTKFVTVPELIGVPEAK